MSVNVSPSDVKAGLPPSLRAIGAVRLLARAVEGGTEAYEVEESGPLRLRFPRLAEDGLEAILINTGGGIAGGDRLEIAVEAGEGARVALTSQAAEKIYRSTGPAARIPLRLAARAGARLDWLPQETILFDRARVARTLDADVAADARLTICEAIVFGRTAMDERVRSGTWRDQWRIRRSGRLMFADALTLDGGIDKILARPAVAAGAAAIATLVQVAPDAQTRLDALRAAFGNEIEAGASAFDGILIARLIAPDGFTLRRALLDALTALDCAPPPAFTL
jgi:urease accessory protein